MNINAENNPCFKSITLQEKTNHYDTILNTLKKIKDPKKKYILPAKVLFLGNTESGKSTLLDFFLQNKKPRIVKNNLNSTHIVQIETLPKNLRKNTIPKAVFYDFGGQDYYHGLYKAFLSNDSINVLLWNSDFDKNQIRKDRNSQLTRDYNRDYWLNQLKFQYDRGKKNISDLEFKNDEPILLVQTHADKENHKRLAYKGDCEDFNIRNEFFIALNQYSIENFVTHNIGLNYLEETLKELIIKKQIVKNEPIWYKIFLNYILRTSKQGYTLLSDLALEYKRDSDKDNLLLPEVLRELAQAGLVLYYKDDIDLKDIVWLDPSKTIQYIHDSILSSNNMIDKKGIIGKDDFDKLAEHKLTKLLLNQKVIFFDEFDNKYIIPGYLPLTEEDGKIYELLTFDFIEPNFVMKFEYFIPFGLINQLICFYGKNKNKKYYWRDQLLFTEDNSKILVKLDFTNLEIIVSIKSKADNKKLDKLEQKIFRDILDLYWDKKNVEEIIQERFNKDDKSIENSIEDKLKATIGHEDAEIQFNSPDDLYVSIDNKSFVYHKDLEDTEKTFNKIMSFGLEIKKEIQNDKEIEIRKLNKNLVSEKASGLFKNFSNNINTQNMKKIFISYSRKDVEYKNELKKHLNMLKTFDISDNWSCEEIKIGQWESQIQKELNDSDLIIYMLSANFFSSKYILENEVKKGMDLVNENRGKNILCVIVSEFSGLDKLKNVLENNNKTILQDSLLNLSSYQYLPYDTVLNTVSNNNEEKIISLKEHSNRNTIEKALTQITEKILEELKVSI